MCVTVPALCLYWGINTLSSIQSSVVQCSAVQLNAVQGSTVPCSTGQCSKVQFSSAQFRTVQYSTVQCSRAQGSSMQCSKMQRSTVQCSIRTIYFVTSFPFTPCGELINLLILLQIYSWQGYENITEFPDSCKQDWKDLLGSFLWEIEH